MKTRGSPYRWPVMNLGAVIQTPTPQQKNDKNMVLRAGELPVAF